MKLLTRAHEWAADHFGFVQYPNVRPADKRTASHTGVQWKTAMPWEYRALIGLFSLIGVVVFGGILVVMLFVIYSVLFG